MVIAIASLRAYVQYSDIDVYICTYILYILYGCSDWMSHCWMGEKRSVYIPAHYKQHTCSITNLCTYEVGLYTHLIRFLADCSSEARGWVTKSKTSMDVFSTTLHATHNFLHGLYTPNIYIATEPDKYPM